MKGTQFATVWLAFWAISSVASGEIIRGITYASREAMRSEIITLTVVSQDEISLSVTVHDVGANEMTRHERGLTWAQYLELCEGLPRSSLAKYRVEPFRDLNKKQHCDTVQVTIEGKKGEAFALPRGEDSAERRAIDSWLTMVRKRAKEAEPGATDNPGDAE